MTCDDCVTLGVTLAVPFPLGSGLSVRNVTNVTSVTTIDFIRFSVTLGDRCDACCHAP